ncbi:argonaute 5-like protein [Tanacetum coccineum]
MLRWPQLLKDDVLGLNDSFGVTEVLGAAITHFKDKSTPLIVTFVASMDAPGSGKYKALLSSQPPGVEIIPNLYTPPLTNKERTGEMLQAFKEQNYGRLSDRIIFYRDGVGDEHFNELLNKEGRSIENDSDSASLSVRICQSSHALYPALCRADRRD